MNYLMRERRKNLIKFKIMQKAILKFVKQVKSGDETFPKALNLL